MPGFPDIPIKVRLSICRELILPDQPYNSDSYNTSANLTIPP